MMARRNVNTRLFLLFFFFVFCANPKRVLREACNIIVSERHFFIRLSLLLYFFSFSLFPSACIHFEWDFDSLVHESLTNFHFQIKLYLSHEECNQIRFISLLEPILFSFNAKIVKNANIEWIECVNWRVGWNRVGASKRASGRLC